MADEDEFSALVGEDVAPIRTEARVVLQRDTLTAETLEKRRQAAQAESIKPNDPLAGEPVTLLEPTAILEFKRPGVQNGVYKNLRLAKYPIDARLDLHNLTVDRARLEVYQFVLDCVNNDVRMALITHGKGEGREQPAVLKSYVALWLPQLEQVLGFHTALKQHGGYGATYVLLKKSEKKKQLNKQLYERP